MASILDVSISSDSEDDADYVPTGEVAASESSGDENCSDDELETPNPKRAKTKKSTKGEKEEETSDLTPVGGANVDPKKHADDIWKSFLIEVESNSTKSSTMTSSDDVKTDSASATIPVEAESKASEVPAANVFEFAGETFTVDDDYKPASLKAKPDESTSAAEGTQGTAKKRGGIDSVLGTLLNKKQKMTTLQKTLYDWKSFKKDEGIEEDLAKFNKGKDGFIERQRFLQRSDVRSFEAEKSVRQSRKKK